jgi:flavin-dependent dehydrogenase
VSNSIHDLVVVGGGPAGLGLAAAAAGRGLDVLLVERRDFPIDQACGEGLLPAGLRALELLGAAAGLGAAEATPITALRWIDPAGPSLTLALPAPGGLGVRRSALSAVLRASAGDAGVRFLEAELLYHRRGRSEVELLTTSGTVRGRLLAAADGRASPIRAREGLDARRSGPARFGVRRHLSLPAWGSQVEVHLGEGVEAYVTPAGAGRIGVAFLFEGTAPGGWPALLARFPALAARLEGAEPLSEDRGAGPLVRRARARVRDRLVLLGDAAGTVDPLSGEGVSLALAGALELAALLPGAIAAGAGREALGGWEAAWRRRQRPAMAWTALLRQLSKRPWLRRRLLELGAARPVPLERLVALALR